MKTQSKIIVNDFTSLSPEHTSKVYAAVWGTRATRHFATQEAAEAYIKQQVPEMSIAIYGVSE